ncbi:DUF5694 domain-containing protein [Sphingomonas sp. RS2018]
MKRAMMAGVLAMLATGAVAQQYRPDFAPQTLKGPRKGVANAVLVLGSTHLANLPKTFRLADLSLLLDRLAAWKPGAIAVEDLSGAQCDQLRRYPARYKDTVESYCPDVSPARAATGLDVPQATEEADRLLAALGPTPDPAQRRRLAAVFLAAGEEGSALVQWLRLPVSERRMGDGLDAKLVAWLERLARMRNETYAIAAPLAARLGLERLVAMDDHSADAVEADPEAAGKAMQAAWTNPASTRRRASDQRLTAAMTSPAGVLALYRAYNARGLARQIYDSDFGAALQEPSPGAYGRRYVGYWETRNLRMAANIRNALGAHPGTRMLVIVGASHKPYLEAYLDQMHDVRLTDAQAVLR